MSFHKHQSIWCLHISYLFIILSKWRDKIKKKRNSFDSCIFPNYEALASESKFMVFSVVPFPSSKTQFALKTSGANDGTLVR